LDHNDLFELEMAVMMMLAAHGYNREDEYGSFSAPQILWAYSNLKAAIRMFNSSYP
jgi:hypothetical protein